MRSRAWTFARGWAWLSLLVGGCDAQAANGYRGESLLTLVGTVEIPEPRAAGPLVPALMFPDQGSMFQLVDVSVKGEFPSDFRIDVYEPPPDSVLRPAPFLDEPAAAIGHITAVPQGHPGIIRFATQTVASASACADEGRCVSRAMWCADAGECYRETRTCPEPDSPDADCTIEAEGDPQLKLPPWEAFAGFSQNYLIAYLSGPVSAKSYTALALGAHQKLAAGYHLLAVREPTEEESAEIESCERDAEDIALARLNEPRGTDYRAEEFTTPQPCFDAGTCAEGFECEPLDDLPQGRLCDLSDAARSELQDTFERAAMKARVELRCPVAGWVLTHVPDAQRERISVRLAPDANPWKRSL